MLQQRWTIAMAIALIFNYFRICGQAGSQQLLQQLHQLQIQAAAHSFSLHGLAAAACRLINYHSTSLAIQ